jgi:predicted Ser/Thr protein kinase
MVGTTIGKYRIIGQLGRGSAGTVYKAVDETLNREVAIKILNPDLANTDIMKRFRREATTLARLNHPEIATIYEVVRSDTDLLMVMEFVRGETLDRLAERLAPMPPDRAAYLIDKVLAGLEHAHRSGIVHRDMKAANVMVTDVGGVKIMDFGIARVRGAEHMTDGCMLGTPAYMAPEQVMGQEVDGRADLYSVGVIFYRLLTGALPFTADTAFGVMQRQVGDPPAPLRTHREDIPEWCETIVRGALAKPPADRFQTAEEFREALGQATGLGMMTDLAKAFTIAESIVITPPPQPPILDKVDTARAHAPLEAAAAVESASTISTADASTLVMRRDQYARAGIALVALASVGVLTYTGLPRPAAEPAPATAAASPAVPAPATAAVSPAVPAPATAAASRPAPAPPPPTAKTFPTVAFDAKALVPSGDGHRERNARLRMADGKIAVMADDGGWRTLYTVAYENVTSISYSRSREPMWNSPTGPARAARIDGGMLGAFRRDREWVSLRTTTKDRFVILRFEDVSLDRVLSALEERTGRQAQLVPVRNEAD